MPTLPHDLALDEVNIVSSWIEAILLGVHCVLYGFCIHTLWPRRAMRSSRMLMTVTTVMIILAVTHASLSLRGLLEGFIWHFAGPDASAAVYYANFAALPYRLKNTIYVANSFIADGLMLWRVWVVWGYDWRAAVGPALLYVGSTVAGILSTITLWHIEAGSALFIVALGQWVTSFWSLSLALNVVCTTMIVVRITRNSLYSRAYRAIIVIVVESGALYTISVALLMCMFELKANAGQISNDITTQLSVIAPTLIIVRVGSRLSERQNTSAMKKVTMSGTSSIPMTPMSPRSQQDTGVIIDIAYTQDVKVDIEKAGTFGSYQGDSQSALVETSKSE